MMNMPATNRDSTFLKEMSETNASVDALNAALDNLYSVLAVAMPVEPPSNSINGATLSPTIAAESYPSELITRIREIKLRIVRMENDVRRTAGRIEL